MAFQPIHTDRLLIRGAEPQDAAALQARRSDPKVYEYQGWELPFTMERAEAMVGAVAAMDGPATDEWWMATVLSTAGDTLGDLAIHLSNEGRTAELGYTFASEHWGHGYAVEAVGAIVARLFDDYPITRIQARLNPENIPSAMVLERTGFVYEGHTKNSNWDRGTNIDDYYYGLTPELHDEWVNRNRAPVQEVTLHPIDQSNDQAVYRLKTHWSQRRFVSPMEHSYADALFPEIYRGNPMIPWLRAVHADGELVAFVMVGLPMASQPEPYLWRLLIDRIHQRRGIGTKILDAIVEFCREQGWPTLMTSWGEGRGTPEPFYLRYGFVPTGEIEDEEIVARLTL